MSFWQPFLKPIQVYIIWLLLEGAELKPEHAQEREKLREWFESEVNANAEARRKQTCGGI